MVPAHGAIMMRQDVPLFDPAVADVMGLAFDAAWSRLVAAGQVFSPHQEDDMREKVALKIVELARRGEREVVRLVELSIAELGFASPDRKCA